MSNSYISIGVKNLHIELSFERKKNDTISHQRNSIKYCSDKILTSYHVSFSDCGAYSKGIKKTRIMHDIKEMIHNRLPVASTTINTGIEHILSRSFC